MLRALVQLFSSYGLAALLLVYLMVLTFLGTIEQGEIGLYEAQRKYFDSWFVRFPWPGGQLAMAVLALNLITGGIVRIRWRWSRAGILVTHFGILLLLAAGWVKLVMSDDGYLRLREGERAAHFTSYYEWELAVGVRSDDGASREFVLSGDRFVGSGAGAVTTLDEARLPFTLELTGFARNSVPRREAPRFPATARKVDGFYLDVRPLFDQAEANVAGSYATLRWRDGREPEESILWGAEELRPWTLFDGGIEYQIALRRKTWPIPFTLQLEDFDMAWHPGTSKPKYFLSDVLKIDGDVVQKVRIQMNEPLRDRGYVFFQSSWGPQDGSPGPQYSVFSVVRNPSDKWPEWACWVIALGLVLHFGAKFSVYARRERSRLAREEMAA